nr:AMP-binding protein [Flavobacteriales bacterium]
MRFNIVTARFEEVDTASSKPAVVGSDRYLSWGALIKEADAMVARISALGLTKGHPVVIRGHKEADMVVSMVACMMLDHPYIPLDLVVPEERVRR